jgi:hypothetical protein
MDFKDFANFFLTKSGDISKSHRAESKLPTGKSGVWSSGCSVPLSYIFNLSIRSGHVPQDWRDANMTPLFKKGSRSIATNYRLNLEIYLSRIERNRNCRRANLVYGLVVALE